MGKEHIIIIYSFYKKVIAKVFELVSFINSNGVTSNSVDHMIKHNFDYAFHIEANILMLIDSFYANQYFKVDESEVNEAVTLVIQVFKDQKKIFEQGLLAMNSIIFALGPYFVRFINDYIPFVKAALKSFYSYEICRLGLSSFCLLSNVFTSEHTPIIEELIPLVLQILTVSSQYLF